MIILGFDSSGLIDYPVIGWHNLVTSSNIAATSAATGYPASNLANPSTANYWLADDANSPPSTTQYLTVSSLSSTYDYLGVAKHNFYSAGCRVTVQTLDEDSTPAVWVDVTPAVTPLDDGPLFFRFARQTSTQIRLKIEAGSREASAAVLYVGLALVLERRIYVDHVPLPHARKVSGPPVYAEGGSYLGRIVTSQKRETVAKISLLSPSWFRAYMAPFLTNAVDHPFFFSWRPASYPLEAGFAALVGDPMPSPQSPSNLISVDLHMVGVV